MSDSCRGRLSSAFVVVALCAGVAEGRASAQTVVAGFADNRFEPAVAGSEWRSLESIQFDGHLRPAFGLVQNWAYKPLVAYDNGGDELAAVVRHQLVGHLNAALLLWDRARVDLALPVPLGQSGSDVELNGQRYSAPDGGAVGDLRLGADVRVLNLIPRQIRAAVGFQLFLPTGNTRAFSGDGGVRFWPRVLVAGARGRVEWAARLGVHLRPKADGGDLAPGSEMNGGLGVAWRVNPRVLVGPELYGSTAIAGGPFASRAGTPIELLLGGQVGLAPGWHLGAGVGRGLTNGAGSPAIRAVVGLQYTFASRPKPIPLPSAPPGWTPAEGTP